MANNRIERNIYILKNREPKVIEYVQGANAVPIMLLLKDYTIPEGATARIYVLKPSGKGEYDTAAIEDNGVLVDVKNTMFNETGVNYIQAAVTMEDKTLITFSQEVEVSPNRVPGEVPESENTSNFLASAANPVFTGSVSMGRTADSTTGESSVAFGVDVQAIGDVSMAVGKSTTAGIREYYIKSIDPSGRKIYLCNEEVLTVISSDDNTDTDFATPGYETGDSFVITNREHYAVEEGIKGISNNVITYEGDLGFTEIRETKTGCTFAVLAKPTVGNAAPAHGMVAAGEDNIAIGVGSFVCNTDNVAVGNRSFSSGWGTRAYGEVSHVEGAACTAEGYAAHAEGYDTKTHGEASHAEGFRTDAAGQASHVEGICTQANGEASHTEGSDTQADGRGSHAEGCYGKAVGTASHAEGWITQANGQYSHAEGQETEAQGTAAHAEGCYGKAVGAASHAEGISAQANGGASHAEGGYTQANGEASHAEGNYGKAVGTASHAEGWITQANGQYSHAEGQETEAQGTAAHAEGISAQANGIASHAEGVYTEAAAYSHAEGWSAKANGNHSHAEGYYTRAGGVYSHVQGKYNAVDTGGKYAHIVGNGTADSNRSNAHTLDWSGNAWFAGTVTSTGADYAEYFEWLDGNPDGEDRVGMLVTLDGERIRPANAGDEILGIISGTAAVLGDNYECAWNGKYLTDNFGRVLYEEVEEFADEIIGVDEETGEPVTEKQSLGVFRHPRLNPDYDPSKEYVNRADRPEWDTVGMIGKLYLRDDGTCEVNQYATAGTDGVATASTEKTGMRVLSRVNENVIRVLLR